MPVDELVDLRRVEQAADAQASVGEDVGAHDVGGERVAGDLRDARRTVGVEVGDGHRPLRERGTGREMRERRVPHLREAPFDRGVGRVTVCEPQRLDRVEGPALTYELVGVGQRSVRGGGTHR